MDEDASRPAAAPERGEVVRAAGAVCWRRAADEGFQVLLVHRPDYDDWSWPKGKLDADEQVAVAAVREVAEETGLEVTLGLPLPAARYRLGATTDKHVSYWAANVRAGDLPPAPHPLEVDRAEWVPAGEAAERLTRRGDKLQLQALVDADAEGILDTFAVLVLRHGHAHPRDAWGRADVERPLVAPGLRQARALVPLLSAWSPRRVLASPAVRCVDTVRPYAQAAEVCVRTKGRLSEDGHRRNPSKVSALVTKVLDRADTAVVCTHRPVLGTLLGALAGNATAGVGDGIPRNDPFLDPGEVLVAHVSRRSGRVVATERHTPC